ncbi:MAG: CDP-diacylglycerol---glycerol-3-phosphate 3-phosphatidyltransferase [Frankiaceae bacterium]|jgi:CDP-diacylglycerol--glycerol-3-phosphate 3-phosphatidyltransferase|nr:CDP-diacylglycerol---glycerol-3-phosphate 3-phosphatidyltransferase [Frankiaceae bacterium]
MRSPAPVVDPATQPAQTARIANIANALTLLRLLLVPAFVALLVANGGHSTGWRVWAFVAFAVATVTDFVDGDLARSRGLVTDVGKVADPIADKMLTGAALIGLSALGDLPWWVTVVILVREIGITALRFFVIRHGVIPASRGGKAKTLLQNVAIGLYILPLTGWSASLRFWLLAIAVVVTIVTGADYIARAVRLRRTSARAEMKRARRLAAGR